MELLQEIKDRDYSSDTTWEIREASRAILFDDNDLIPFQ